MRDLLIRVTDAAGRSVTVDAPGDLRFSSTIPGGFDTLTATMPWPADIAAPDILSGASRVQVVDTGHGGVVWHGRLNDPGQTVTPGLSAYEVVAGGERSLLDGFRSAYCLVDRDLSHWTTVVMEGGQAQIVPGANGLAAWPGDWAGSDVPTEVVEHSIPTGTVLPTGGLASVQYMPGLYMNPGEIAQVTGSVKGINPFGGFWPMGIWTVIRFDDPFGAVLMQNFSVPETQYDWAIRLGDSPWSESTVVQGIQLTVKYTGPAIAEVVNSAVARHANLIVYGPRYRRDGTRRPPADGGLYAGQIVEDLLGRGFRDYVDAEPEMDLPDAAVDQACWWGGVSAREIMDFIASYAPGHWWAVWAPNDAADLLGRPRFEYQSWTRPVRYHLTQGPGISIKLGGGAEQVANQAMVVYQRTDTAKSVTTVVVPVPVLDNEGIVRTTTVDLTGRGPITMERAAALGESALVELDGLKTSGQVVVSCPVFDRALGRMVEPWEIRPGAPVQVSLPTSSSLHGPDATPDGQSVFRLTGVSYEHRSRTATLTLDGGQRSLVSRARVEVAPRRYVPANATVGG